MKKRLLQSLARLGSLKYHKKTILMGTSDEYVLPEDLVEDVASLCLLAKEPQYAKNFTTEEIDSLDDMVILIRKHGKKIFTNLVDVDAEYFINENEDWLALREASSRCLTLFGFDVELLLPNDIDEGDRVFNS